MMCRHANKVLFSQLEETDPHLKNSKYLNYNHEYQRSWKGGFIDAEQNQRQEREGNEVD